MITSNLHPMTNPITPPPELVQQWVIEGRHLDHCTVASHIAAQAAQWGSDQELEACCEWLSGCGCESYGRELRAARRPKPPSLKEQALKMLRPLSNPVMPGTPEYRLYEPQAEIIRRALEALPDD
jgi:hypothetical protein